MKTSLQRYIEQSNFLIGEEYTQFYINHIEDILSSKQFYSLDCELPLTTIKNNCPLTHVASSFPINTYWATFHSDWYTQFGKFIIRKGTTIIDITRDVNTVRVYLGLQIK